MFVADIFIFIIQCITNQFRRQDPETFGSLNFEREGEVPGDLRKMVIMMKDGTTVVEGQAGDQQIRGRHADALPPQIVRVASRLLP